MIDLNDTVFPLSPEARAAWLAVSADNLKQQFIAKYQEGQREHGGDLGAVPTIELLREAQSEVLDQAAYLREMERRLVAYNSMMLDLATIIAGLRQSKRLTAKHRTMVLKVNEMLGMEDYIYKEEPHE